MKSVQSVIAVCGTVILLGLAVCMHAAGQFGRFVVAPATEKVSEAIALAPSNFDDFSPSGKEVDAIYGDLTLRNGFLTAVIAQPLATRHANMTVKDVAGALIDLSVRSDSGGDQLAAFYPGRKAYPYRSVSLRDANGRVVAANEPGGPGATASVVVQADGADGRPEVTVEYGLSQQQRFVTLTSTFTNRSAKPMTVPLEDDFRADGGKEDMVRSPNGTSSRFWLYDRFWGQAYGLDAEGYKLQLTSDSKNTTIKYENAAGETSVKLAPGESFSLVRRLYPAATIFDVHAIAQNLPTSQETRIAVRDSDKRPSGNLSIELLQGETSLGMARMDKTDNLTAHLPAGRYTAKLYFCGNPVAKSEVFHVEAGQASVTLASEIPRGRITGAISDSNGKPIPCKIELKPLAEGSKLDFGPETAEFAVRNLIYTPNGTFDQAVPVGKYAVTISHGPEFDIVQDEVTISAGSVVPLAAKLVRSVETSGWVSSDFHSHSSPSGDNTSSQLGPRPQSGVRTHRIRAVYRTQPGQHLCAAYQDVWELKRSSLPSPGWS